MVYPKIEDMRGQTFTDVSQSGVNSIRFTRADGTGFVLQHHQDCCESVYIESVVGDLADLVGSPILLAEEVSNEPGPPIPADFAGVDSYTWTFYKFGTIKGGVTIRWFGASNGYYSESVDLDSF